MQPNLARASDADGQEAMMRRLVSAAAETTPGWRVHRIAVQPFGDAVSEGTGLGFGARQPAIELGDPGALVKEGSPVLGRPAAITDPQPTSQQLDDAGLMLSQQVENGRRRLRRPSSTRSSSSTERAMPAA